jgi:SAM-dependent methyltransferase
MDIQKLSNPPFEKHEVEDYERRRYRGQDQKLVDRREKRILRKILQRFAAGSLRALDLPCGYGRFSRLLLDKGFSLVSSDISFHMVKRAMERNPGSALLSGVVADAKQGLPFKNVAFNVVLSMRFFHHLHQKQDREKILSEFSRVCSDCLILSYYQRNWLHSLQRKLRRRIKRTKTEIKMLSRQEFYEEVEASAFKAARVFPLFRGLHSQHVALLKKKQNAVNL